jgi:Dihydrofolate reductase
MISIISAIAENRAIGIRNTMPWHLPEELQHFKAVTMGKTMIMGRKTFESLPGILSGRQYIVITANSEGMREHARLKYCDSLDKALEPYISSDEEVMVIGGGQIYSQALKYTDKLYLTRIHKTYEAEVFFPEINEEEWKLTYISEEHVDSESKISYHFENYKKQNG